MGLASERYNVSHMIMWLPKLSISITWFLTLCLKNQLDSVLSEIQDRDSSRVNDITAAQGLDFTT